MDHTCHSVRFAAGAACADDCRVSMGKDKKQHRAPPGSCRDGRGAVSRRGKGRTRAAACGGRGCTRRTERWAAAACPADFTVAPQARKRSSRRQCRGLNKAPHAVFAYQCKTIRRGTGVFVAARNGFCAVGIEEAPKPVPAHGGVAAAKRVAAARAGIHDLVCISACFFVQHALCGAASRPHAVVKKIRHGPALGVEIGDFAVLIYGAESFPKPAHSLVGFFGEQVRRIRLGGPGEIVAESAVDGLGIQPARHLAFSHDGKLNGEEYAVSLIIGGGDRRRGLCGFTRPAEAGRGCVHVPIKKCAAAAVPHFQCAVPGFGQAGVDCIQFIPVHSVAAP